VIRDGQKALEVYRSVAAAIRKEALWVLPSARAFIRVKNAGVLDILVSAATRGATVNVLCPVDSSNSNLVKDYENLTPTLEIRKSEPGPTTLLIVDRQLMFTSELRDDSVEDTKDAISNSVYSSSIPTIHSHITLFDALWKQKEIIEAVTSAAEIKKDFINVAAHELRTPILPILLSAESLEEGIETDDRTVIANKVAIIVRNAKRLSVLINNILDAARIENGSFSLKMQKSDLSQFIQSIIADETLKLSFDSPVSIEFKNELPSGFESSFDKDRLGQVLTNLLDNAIKFTKSGKVTITAAITDGKKELISISVRDSGIGIDPAIIGRLFTKFATKSTIKSGTGLGLYISRTIVEAHGGSITAKNNEDGGATFTVLIPKRD
jgi:signal transduction histidine kinase